VANAAAAAVVKTVTVDISTELSAIRQTTCTASDVRRRPICR